MRTAPVRTMPDRIHTFPRHLSDWRAARRAEAEAIIADSALCAARPHLAMLATQVIKKARGLPVILPPSRPGPTGGRHQ